MRPRLSKATQPPSTFPPCLPPAVCSCYFTCVVLVGHLSDPARFLAERKAAGLVI